MHNFRDKLDVIAMEALGIIKTRLNLLRKNWGHMTMSRHDTRDGIERDGVYAFQIRYDFLRYTWKKP